MIYTDEYRNEIIRKIFAPGGPGIPRLSEETGIHQATLYKWRNDAKNGVMNKRKSRSPGKWSLTQKLGALLESKSKTDEELGAWLREKGIHSDHLKLWEKEITAALSADDSSDEKKKLEKENKELLKEVRRKDAALAEATALLILKKKFEALMEGMDRSGT